jgi:hypothetical protein
MKSFQDSMNEYKKQMQKGDIQEAYKNLMNYIMELRTYFEKKYPTFFVSGSLYYGYMDMTYFSIFPDSLKKKKLKIGIVFCHDTCRFEIWLFGYNKQIQTKYWALFKENKWKKYHLPSSTKGVDYIVQSVLVENPDFNDLEKLTKRIEKETLKFIMDVEEFLSTQ